MKFPKDQVGLVKKKKKRIFASRCSFFVVFDVGNVVCHVSPVGVGARSGSATLTYARSTVKEWCEAAQLSRLSSPDPLTGPRIASGRWSCVSSLSSRGAKHLVQ